DADPGVLDRDQHPLGPRRQLDPDVGDRGGQHYRDEPDDRLARPAAGIAEQRHHVRADRQRDRDHSHHVGQDRDPPHDEPEVRGGGPPAPGISRPAVPPPPVQPPERRRDRQHRQPADQDRDRAGERTGGHHGGQGQRDRRGGRGRAERYPDVPGQAQ